MAGSFDAVVIGGGVASTPFHLTRLGCRALLPDHGELAGGGAAQSASRHRAHPLQRGAQRRGRARQPAHVPGLPRPARNRTPRTAASRCSGPSAWRRRCWIASALTIGIGAIATDVGAGWALLTLRRSIGYVIQQVELLPHTTVEQSVCTVPALLGWDRARKRAHAAELLGMASFDPAVFFLRYPRELSGRQQRVGVARALAYLPWKAGGRFSMKAVRPSR